MDDSSPRPPHKNKTRGAGSRKIPSSPKMALIPKVKKGKKVPTWKATKATPAVRKLASNGSDNSSPDADTSKVIPNLHILLIIFHVEYS